MKYCLQCSKYLMVLKAGTINECPNCFSKHMITLYLDKHHFIVDYNNEREQPPQRRKCLLRKMINLPTDEGM